jgi:hypothetical protein
MNGHQQGPHRVKPLSPTQRAEKSHPSSIGSGIPSLEERRMQGSIPPHFASLQGKKFAKKSPTQIHFPPISGASGRPYHALCFVRVFMGQHERLGQFRAGCLPTP